MADTNPIINQIQWGSNTFDIATYHGISFKTGTDKQVWNGSTDLEVVIPTLSDLVKDPIKFAGTVGANGSITWVSGHGNAAEKGDLVFFTSDVAAFETKTGVTKACEAGDMAVYDGSKWYVTTGENQVTIKAGTTPTSTVANLTEVTLSTTAKTVLNVEGKELALKVPNVTVSKNTAQNLTVTGDAKVGTKYISLGYTAATSDTIIGSNKDIALPSVLASGKVTFTGDTSLVTAANISNAWTAGTKASAAVTVSISGQAVTLTKGAGSDFVTGVSSSSTDSFVKNALKSVSLTNVAADAATDSDFVYLASNPTFTNDATTFATGVSAVSSGADFTIPGAVSVSTTGTGNDVITGVTLPTLSNTLTDTTLADGNDSNGVLSSIGNPTVTVQNSNVISSVSVSGSVLIFNSATVSATATQGTATYKKVQYSKATFSNNGSVTIGHIVTAAGQGYKLDKQAVNATFTGGTVKYLHLSTADVSAVDKVPALTGITLSTGAYTAETASNAKGSIPANTVITSVTLPTLGAVTPTGSIAGSVGTALTTSNVQVGELTTTAINIGTYSLSASTTTTTGAVPVGKEGSIQVSGTASVPASTFVTDVTL